MRCLVTNKMFQIDPKFFCFWFLSQPLNWKIIAWISLFMMKPEPMKLHHSPNPWQRSWREKVKLGKLQKTFCWGTAAHWDALSDYSRSPLDLGISQIWEQENPDLLLEEVSGHTRRDISFLLCFLLILKSKMKILAAWRLWEFSLSI